MFPPAGRVNYTFSFLHLGSDENTDTHSNEPISFITSGSSPVIAETMQPFLSYLCPETHDGAGGLALDPSHAR